MTVQPQSVGARAPARPDAAPAKRMLAAGEGWSVHEIICRAGPSDRPFAERHEGFSVSAVVEGSFTYRSDIGHGLLYPGALLLGNDGGCFECGHAHGIGDRCISLNVREDEFAEIATAVAASSRFRFAAPSLPPSPKALPVIAHMEALSSAPIFAAPRGAGVAAHRARHRRDSRRSTFPGCADGARGETGGRGDPTGRQERGEAGYA